MFSTIGCSAKQNLVFSSVYSLDKPLSGSKALSLNNQRTGCVSFMANSSLRFSVGNKNLLSGGLLSYPLDKMVSYCFSAVDLGLFYSPFIVDNKPPLYVLFRKLKLCIVL